MVLLSEQSSSSTHDHKYDVFLSFRGCDTRLSFTDHLHKALIDANITTFMDNEEIEAGLYLKLKLESAIKASKASIVVLSENYASSTWCLNELVLILDQHRTTGHIVIPIFYHVDPANIRKQQYSFGDAMAKHKERMEAETIMEKKSQLAQTMEIWKKALIEVADLKGKDARGRQETKFIEEIVKEIYHRVGIPLKSTIPLLFGMEYSIEFITSWLKDGSLHTVDILSILGFEGIGKTSLARYVYGLHYHLFDKSSFIEGVNEKCAKHVNGLLDLQRQLCDDISKTSSVQIHDVSRYTYMIEEALVHESVLIVLDDIDSLKQLDALLGKKGFHPGSKIIITSEDMSLSEKYAPIYSKVQPKHTKLLLEGLHDKASLQLLSYHAFKGKDPQGGYDNVLKKLVAYCQGHPLALKVLGQSLQGREVGEWEECLEGLKEETNSHIQKALHMSFESIFSSNDKELFKHIACFLEGKDRAFVETILKACGIRTLHGIQNLINRCLLTIGPRNEIKMHKLIQDMGRNVVRQESPDKPWKRSRLWCPEESFKVLQQNKGTGKLKGLALDMEMVESEKLFRLIELKTNAFSRMENLMLLQLNYIQLNGSYKYFPKNLRWLCMHGFPLKSIPLDLPMENLVALDMSYSKLESFNMSHNDPQWHGKRQKLIGGCSKDKRLLGNLKILNLSFCKQLRRLGGFFELPTLERLILANCITLIEVCESIEQCHELVLIDLSYCDILKCPPRTMIKLKKVETLLLNGWNLRETPIEIIDMDLPNIHKENNNGVNSQTTSSSIMEAISRDFKSITISLPSSLVCLSLKDNFLSNEAFPNDFSSLSMLKELYLDGNSIISLPNCVRSLHRLEKLSVKKCRMLKTLEHPPCTLKHLIFYSWHSIQKIEFDRKMSPLTLSVYPFWTPYSCYIIEGMFKVEVMKNVAEEVLCSLGWTNLEFPKYQRVENRHFMTKRQKSEVQVYYEFGIFSTIFEGIELPNWINHRCSGSLVSFTMSTSPEAEMFRGLNFCYMFTNTNYCLLPYIQITNITKNHTWIYDRYSKSVSPVQGCAIFLSHWMFGKNEMADGDQISISVLILKDDIGGINIRECGVNLVYDDGNGNMEEEDPLDYYKSWNHIIGGDLSAFQTTTGEYLLDITRFFGGWLPWGSPCYAEMSTPAFRAFSERHSNIISGKPEGSPKLCLDYVPGKWPPSETKRGHEGARTSFLVLYQ